MILTAHHCACHSFCDRLRHTSKKFARNLWVFMISHFSISDLFKFIQSWINMNFQWITQLLSYFIKPERFIPHRDKEIYIYIYINRRDIYGELPVSNTLYHFDMSMSTWSLAKVKCYHGNMSKASRLTFIIQNSSMVRRRL